MSMEEPPPRGIAGGEKGAETGEALVVMMSVERDLGLQAMKINNSTFGSALSDLPDDLTLNNPH